MKFQKVSNLFTGRAMLSVRRFAGLGLGALMALSLGGQDFAVKGRVPLPVDWSFNHVVETMSFTKQQAARMKNDPRLYYQWLLKGHVQAPGKPTTAGQAASLGAAIPKPTKPAKSSNKVDWSLSLGSLGVAKNQFPAKFNFDINSTPDCTNDFVVYALNGTGSSGQANLVGVNNLYSGTGPTGLCGAAPTVYFAYDISTPGLAGSAITNSPVLSQDGTEIAFIESGSNQTILHVLAWAPNSGTVAAPLTTDGGILPATSAAPFMGCFVPCLVSLPLDGSFGDSNSSIYYDYSGSDTAYVANDSGTVFTITGLFLGTPSILNMTYVGATTILASPIYDGNSGSIFVGGANGILYKIDSSSNVTQLTVGTAPITDPVQLDVTNGRVYSFSGSNGTNSVVVQSDESLGSVATATLGTPSGSVGLHAGTPDNQYFLWNGGTSGNPGHFYFCADTGGVPTLYGIPFSYLTGLNLASGGSGYTSMPTLNFSPGGGTGAAAALTGNVTSLTLSGTTTTGYTNPAFSGFTGGGATTAATATFSASLFSIPLTSGGSGYTSVPGVTLTGGGAGSGGAGTAVMGIGAIGTITPGSGFTSVPAVGNFSFSGAGGTGASVKSPSLGVVGISVPTPGGSYSSTTTAIPVTATTTPGAGTGFSAKATGSVNNPLTPGTLGSGYTSQPTVGFSGGGGGTGAAATAFLGLSPLTVNVQGTGYNAPQSLTIGAPTGTGTVQAAATTSLGVVSIGTISGGSYLSSGSFPSASFSGGTPGSAATVSSVTATVSSIALGANKGSGFTTSPSITFTPAGATASTTLGILSIASSAGSVYTSTTTTSVSIGTPTGSPALQAAATAQFGVQGLALSNPGSGFTGAASVAIGSGNATATASLGLVGFTGLAAGSGYTTFPTVGFTGGGSGSGAGANATVGISAISVAAPGTTPVGTATINSEPSSGDTITVGSDQYKFRSSCSGITFCVALNSSTTTVATNLVNAINGSCGGTACTANASVKARSSTNVVSITNITASTLTFSKSSSAVAIVPSSGGISAGNGSSFCSTGTQTLTFSGAGGTGAGGTATVASNGVVSSVSLSTAGSGYTAIPSFTVPGCTTQPTETVAMKLTGLTITGAGSGYTAVPGVTISGTGGSGAGATALLGVVTLTLTGPGNNYGGLSSLPSVSITDTGGAHGAVASVSSFTVVGVTVGTGGTGYTSVPTATLTSGCTTCATLTPSMQLATISLTAGGSYTTAMPTPSSPGGGASVPTFSLTVTNTTFTAGSGYNSIPSITYTTATGGTTATAGPVALGVVGITMGNAGAGYTGVPTVTVPSPQLGGTTATVNTVTMLVSNYAVTSGGSGYTMAPVVTVGAPGSGTTATATAPINVTTVTVNTPYSTGYTGVPTIGFTNVTSPPTASTSMGITTVALNSAGTGYTSNPTLTVTGGGGSGFSAPTTLAVVNVAVTAGSGYTSSPTVSFSGGNATAGPATLNPTSVTLATGGAGYTSAPTVTFTGGGAGLTLSATLSVNAFTLTNAGNGYSQSFTPTLTGGGGTGAAITATAAPGYLMPTGTPTLTKAVPSAPSGAECSPLTEIFTGSNDLIFWGTGSASFGEVSSQDVTTVTSGLTGTYTTATEPSAPGGSSAIVVDNISTQPQASSIYFGTLAKSSFTNNDIAAIASVTSPGTIFGNNVATVTTIAPEDFTAGESVVISGVSCTAIGCPNYNGTWTILATSGNMSFTFTQCTSCFSLGGTATADTGQADHQTTTSAYGAIKLTQSGLH